MKYYGQTKEVIDDIMKVFEKGNLPDALAPIFINRNDSKPSDKWSWCNKMVMFWVGMTTDARTMKQWNKVGRKVSKGSKAFQILGPCIKKIEKETEDGKKEFFNLLYGFKGIPVFPIEKTEITDKDAWEKHCQIDEKEKNRLENLPLREVIENWGLELDSYNGKNSGALGYYVHDKRIMLGVENMSTFFHELVHASDDRLNNLKKGHGQDPSNEIVAEMGGAILAKILGFDLESDIGGCYKYCLTYSENDKNKLIKNIFKLLDRICNAVNNILEESDKILQETV